MIENGIREMYDEDTDVFYYLTIYNENYEQPPAPDGPRRRRAAAGPVPLRRRPRGSLDPGHAAVQRFGAGGGATGP